MVAKLYGMEILQTILTVEQGAGAASPAASVVFSHQLSRMLIFSVPVIVYFMILRAPIRILNALDALDGRCSPERKMLDTHFLLSEKGRADERDRPLILWALFRQTPGHGPDGIEPPDFTEVIKAGLDRGSKAS
ncbi:hypothetical protein FS815_25605 [Agrobacterium vitis]|uniref:hypothetical protein n=1 Tax=Allorhizobium ampelinum TaxID=3025782 RepID=UPI001F1B49CB|nr:hypothetical protein [Allorhizobium ampelinum]MCF1450168.1 hypothetical protein [Allorhizobium ampelinum]